MFYKSARHVAGQRVSNDLRSSIYDLRSTSRLQGQQDLQYQGLQSTSGASGPSAAPPRGYPIKRRLPSTGLSYRRLPRAIKSYQELVDPVLRHVYAYQVILPQGDLAKK